MAEVTRTMVRTLDEQFGKKTVKRITVIIGRVNKLSFPLGASRYYAMELAGCLEAGLLLASIHMAASFLELFVRGLYIQKFAVSEISLEKKRKLGFACMIDALAAAHSFKSKDVEPAKQFYRQVRTPIFHGLSGRLVSAHDPFRSLLSQCVNMQTTSTDVEDVIEDKSLSYLERLLSIIERNGGRDTRNKTKR